MGNKRREEVFKISTFALTDEQVAMVEACDLRHHPVKAWDCPQDVIAHYSDLVVIDPSAADADDLAMLASFFAEVDPQDAHILLSGPCAAFDGISTATVVAGALDDVEQTKVAMMRCLKEAKRDIDHSQQVASALRILFFIQGNPGATTREIAELFELSERTVRRRIRTLQAAGVFLEYDRSAGGWTCVMDPKETL